MKKKLYIGFKGKHNSSRILVSSMNADSYLLTNSFGGLKRDIESLSFTYDYVVLFGADNKLRDTVKIEMVAEKETIEFSAMNLESISAQLAAVGISNCLCNKPTHYLCNDAYWHLLRKFNGNAVLIHIPPAKYMNQRLVDGLKKALGGN